MATLVLTAVGTAIGGPIGGAIGAVVGQQIDQRIFAPKGRKGPRLGELAVQTSSYGSAIPKILGTMRVAGTVIWATDLKEDKHKSGGGKGRPKTTTYSYSASFAVALSGRSILGVRRIWADGKLLRGAAGDFKSETEYRLYHGSEEQEPDPLIASAEGAGAATAYRGIAYAVFEDFQLADYGNRIPSLTFEVEADAGPVTIGAVARVLSDGAVADGGTAAVAGYAASGDNVRAAIEALADVVPLSLADEAGGLVVRMKSGAVLDLPSDAEGARGAGDSGGRTEMGRLAAGAVPGEVTVTYYDPARDYQAGLQRAVRGERGARVDARALPATLSADAAKGLAEHRLATLWNGRATARLHLPWRWSGVRAGAGVRMIAEGGSWRVVRWTLDRMVVSLELVRERAGAPALPAATPGRPIGHPDIAHGPTILRLLELPLLSEPLVERPMLFAAAAGIEPGWRRAALSASYDGGASWEAAGATALPAVMGTALTALAPAGSALFDDSGTLEVDLLNEAMWLESRDDAALLAGANLALVGRELLQFGRAEPLGMRRFRLSRLLRGRRGTEWASAHGPGEPFTMIEPDALVAIEPPSGTLGAEARLIAIGIGDSSGGSETSVVISSSGLVPPSPVHLRAIELADGGLEVRWVRRSRAGWSWSSGSDAPLAEEKEAYRIELAGSGFTRTAEVGAAAYVYTAADRAADGAGPVAVTVVQIGTHGASRPAQIAIS